MTALSPEFEAYFKQSRGGWIFASGLFGFGAFIGSRFAPHYQVSHIQKAAIGQLMSKSRRVQAKLRWLVVIPAVLVSGLAAIAKSQPGGVDLMPVPLLVLAAAAIWIGLMLLAIQTWQVRRKIRQMLTGAPVVDERISAGDVLRHRATTMPTHRIAFMLAGTTCSATWFAMRVFSTAGPQSWELRTANMMAAAALAALAVRAGALMMAKRSRRPDHPFSK